MSIHERTISLLGEQNFKNLQNKKIIVFGLGGVGGYVVEMLARSGIKHLTLVDFDTVSETNINRQIIANSSTVGKLKTECFAERIKSINKDCIVLLHSTKIVPENVENFDLKNYDYVIDCIDMVTSKIALIKYCYDNKIKIISSMGTANKYAVPKFEICDIFETENDGLARVLRKKLKDEGVKNCTVIYSKQEAKKQKELGSIAYFPSMCGIMISAFVINEFLKKGEILWN